MKWRLLFFSLVLVLGSGKAFSQDTSAAFQWASNVFKSLSQDERIAQLLVVRSSGMDAKGNPVVYDDRIDSLVSQYNIGGICAFQGTALQQALMFNRIQSKTKTPVMITVDGEWGLGMRFAGVKNFPYQLTLGAISDADLVYKIGKAIGEQCRRMNIHVNYAPVVDVNNNPDNPVIGLRSFGENKYQVSLMGSRMMEGIQSEGVMACAKHFPGHGDVAVDSHLDLPVINKTLEQLDTLELYPFRQLIHKGVGSMIVAHLSIPAIDTTANQPTSLSYRNITELLKGKLGFKGLVFTDALEMKGVTKYYPGGEASVQALIAGNDMLCLPESVPQSIEAVKKAIADGRLTWMQLNNKCMRVLMAKYNYVVGKTGVIDTANLVNDLNRDVAGLRKQVAEKAFTVLAMEPGFLPLKQVVSKSKNVKTTAPKILYIAVGADSANQISARLKTGYKADVMILPYTDSAAIAAFDTAKLRKYKKIIIGLHRITRSPAKNFGIPANVISLINSIQGNTNTILLTFGNPYSNKFFTGAKNLIACYEDDSVFQDAAADLLAGKIIAQGKLPVTVGSFAYGSGLVQKKNPELVIADSAGLNAEILKGIDSIAIEAINEKAAPGCVVTVLRNGKLAYQKAFGTLTYNDGIAVTTNTIYDLASVTKISATTIAVMKLVEEGRLNVKDPVSKYLPWLKGSNKENILIENLLLHQAGLNPYIPFYREIVDKEGKPKSAVTSPYKTAAFNTTVAEGFYLRNDWPDTMFQRIKESAVNDKELKYVYSDNDFILLGKVVQAISGQTLDDYVTTNFYEPLGMTTTRFKAFEKFTADNIAPTENEKEFRSQLIWTYVHDPGAAMFNNVSGHAGLFSNGSDLSVLYQMLLNGGVYKGKRYLKKETIDWFTSYQTPISRRGLGFDKPEKDNNIRTVEKAYPAKSVSPLTFGHTGFTGTCVWVDPKYNLVYIFLSNRVNPSSENNLLSELNIRSRIQEVIYKAIIP